MKKHDLNVLLYRMLGSEDLVSRWWHTPNRHWLYRSPYAVWREDPKRVEDYILSFAYGDYS